MSSRSRSSGAGSPTRGALATGIGGGTGVSHGCTVRGRFLTVIHAGQAEAFPSFSKPPVAAKFPGDEFRAGFGEDDVDEVSGHGMLNESLDRPTFLRATLVARLENMVYLGVTVQTSRLHHNVTFQLLMVRLVCYSWGNADANTNQAAG